MKIIKNRSLARLIFYSILGSIWSFSAIGQPLDIADTPLFVTNNVKPNIIVAVDDSGSMDFELLYSTDGGTLWWNRSTQRFVDGSGDLYSPPQNQQGNYFNYTYLFPNNCNDNNARDRRAYCSGSNFFAVPPIPQFAFTRSAAFNREYFNPLVTYKPWVGYGDARPQRAWADPAIRDDSFDLTSNRRRNNTFESFVVGPGMNLPAGTEINTGNGWYFLNGNAQSGNYIYLGINYFPATFYLPSNSPLPQSSGYSAAPTNGSAPNGADMLGYEIRRENFNSKASYDAMIQNFANWFSYYRKRHLATRAGIAGAFDQVNGFNVGVCTINQTGDQNSNNLNYFPVTMRDLDTQRESFIDQILGIDFSQGLGTPNRHALHFLGRQFANNNAVVQQPCQKNFAILFTDGYTGDRSYSAGVGNADKNMGPIFADSESNTLADIAAHYYQELGDLLSGRFLPGQVEPAPGCDSDNPDPSLDCQEDLHMVTFGVTLGQQGTIFGADEDATYDPYNNPPNWDSFQLGTYGPGQVDDLWHATVNSRGALLNANTPEEIADSFADTLQQIADTAGSASSLAVNSGTITQESRIYQASFQSGRWRGGLKNLPISDGTGNATCTANNAEDTICPAVWDAADLLDQANLNNRVVLTANQDGRSGIPFRHNGLTESQRQQLTPQQLNFIRGDRSRERARVGNNANGEVFRDRPSLLGDIVNSSPVFVGSPNRLRYPIDWRDALNEIENTPEDSASAYRNPLANNDFIRSQANRSPMVYVGANDGMLHGFDAITGAERLAYVPKAVVPNLAELTRRDYGHEFFVDGNPVEKDALIIRNGAAQWRTVLVSGLRAGGRSIFALDITDPSVFSEQNAANTVMWEYTDPNLGLTFSEPTVERLHNGEWAAIFGNGYNSATQTASLYIVNLSTGQLIKKLETNAGPNANDDDDDDGNNLANGLGSVFSADLDGDFIIDYVYAGDLYGNVWKFDLTSTDPSQWKVAFGSESAPEPLFTARDASGNRQPITVKPQIDAHPFGLDHGVMVYFGTGKYLEQVDSTPSTNSVQSFYGIWDIDVFSTRQSSGEDSVFSTNTVNGFTRNRLTTQTILDTVTSNGQNLRLISNNTVQYQQSGDSAAAATGGANKRGWVLDLSSGTGEMVVTDAVLRGGLVNFSTLIPSETPCQVGGSGFFMSLDSATGGRALNPIFDLNRDGLFNNNDLVQSGGKDIAASGIFLSDAAPGQASILISRQGATSKDVVIVPKYNGEFVSFRLLGDIEGRQTWRELRR